MSLSNANLLMDVKTYGQILENTFLCCTVGLRLMKSNIRGIHFSSTVVMLTNFNDLWSHLLDKSLLTSCL